MSRSALRPSPLDWLRSQATSRIIAAGVAGVLVVPGLSWSLLGLAPEAAPTPSGPELLATATNGEAPTAVAVPVDVVTPTRGGAARLTVQPGTVHAFESVELFAKASGYLKTQSVDIGSRIKRGDLLAEIDAPELVIDVEAAEAALARSEAQCEQARARARTAEAERESAHAAVAQARADQERLVARRSLSEKQLDRIKALSERDAVDARLVDEQTHDLEAAQAGERAGEAAIRTALAQDIAAVARVQQAQADVDEAQAAIRLAAAHRDRARAIAEYMKIEAPFDGVVSRRNFHPGAFVRSAAEGGTEPLLTVARTDVMRLVMQVPELDVPFLNVGDRATVTVDALKEAPLEGTISRIACAENPETRTMRAEIDLPNPDGRLVEGMFARVSVALHKPTDRLCVPSGCVVQHSPGNRGVLFVARDGQAARLDVALGADDGTQVEIVEGLGPRDKVIVRPPSGLGDGDAVIENSAQAAGPASR